MSTEIASSGSPFNDVLDKRLSASKKPICDAPTPANSGDWRGKIPHVRRQGVCYRGAQNTRSSTHSAGRGGALSENDALSLRGTEPLDEFHYERSIDRVVLRSVELNEYPKALAIGEQDVASHERIFDTPVQQFDRGDGVECPAERKRAAVPDECAAFHDDAATMPACARRGQGEAGSDMARRGGIAIVHALSRHPC